MSKRRTIEFAVGLVLLSVLVGAAAGWAKGPKPAGPPPDAVLTWNTYAVNAVRASTPTKVQTDGMVYMSYVQAAVYDAVTKLEGRYEPYHDFAFASYPNASVQAAVAAAARTTLDNYLPDQQPTVDAEYNTYLATLTGNVAGGVALGEAAAHDLIAFRAGDGLKAATPSYGGIGPILPGQWQLQPGQAVQTPWLATMRPFLLDQASQFRAEPPPALTSHQYAKDLNETEAYGALNSTVRTPEQTRDRVLLGREQHQPVQPDDAERRGAARAWTSSTPRTCSRWARSSRPTPGSRASTRSSSTSSGARSRRSGTPTRTATPTRPPTRRGSRCYAVPGHPEYPSQHGCFTAAFSDALASVLHTNHLDVTMPGGENGSTVLTTTQHFDTVHDIQYAGRSTPASGSASTSATRSSRARSSATTSPTGSSTASSSRITPSYWRFTYCERPVRARAARLLLRNGIKGIRARRAVQLTRCHAGRRNHVRPTGSRSSAASGRRRTSRDARRWR